MSKEPIAYIIERECCVCGKPFEVRVDWNTNEVLTECFYGGTIKRGVGNWSQSKAKQDNNGNLIKDEEGLIIWEKCQSWWKELYYRIVDFKRLILHQYTEIEYWECPSCYKKIKEKNK